ncbi:MAG: hypothetical protein AAFW84_05770 [Cyanobacteria bacterium J06635_15]
MPPGPKQGNSIELRPHPNRRLSPELNTQDPQSDVAIQQWHDMTPQLVLVKSVRLRLTKTLKP